MKKLTLEIGEYTMSTRLLVDDVPVGGIQSIEVRADADDPEVKVLVTMVDIPVLEEHIALLRSVPWVNLTLVAPES